MQCMLMSPKTKQYNGADAVNAVPIIGRFGIRHVLQLWAFSECAPLRTTYGEVHGHGPLCRQAPTSCQYSGMSIVYFETKQKRQQKQKKDLKVRMPLWVNAMIGQSHNRIWKCNTCEHGHHHM